MAGHVLAGLTLPSGMVWVDEFDWVPVQKSDERSITGALVIDVVDLKYGRPITLAAVNDQGWIARSDLQLLQALASAPGARYSLTLADGRAFAVQFVSDTPVTATPIGRPELPSSQHPYVATARLMTVE